MSPCTFDTSLLRYSIVVSICIVFSVVCFKVYFRLAICLESLPWLAKHKHRVINLNFPLTPVLRILLLNLGQVLKLDSFTLENAALHIFDKLFLLLAELVIAEFHAMNFLAHGNDLGLTDGGVKSFLHFLFELGFALPEQNLALSFDNLSEELSL